MNLHPPDLRRLKAAVMGVLADPEENVTPESIRKTIKRYRQVHPPVSDADAEALARELEMMHDVIMPFGDVLSEREYRPWLDDARSEIDFFYWDRYRDHLARRGFGSRVLTTIDRETDRTLDFLENPRTPGTWDRRGMVMGSVQSGKTSHYIGLMCKAADAGYRVIIVIAGIHNNLRAQTQTRVDEGFIGLDSARLLTSPSGPPPLVGVGRGDSRRRPNPFTNAIRDFNLQTARAINLPLKNLREPAVFVIKKNAAILRSLLGWLRAYTRNAWASSMRWRARSTARRQASRLSSRLRPLRSLGIPARICPALTRERLGSSLGLAAEGIVDATSARIPTMNTRWRDWGTPCSSLRTT